MPSAQFLNLKEIIKELEKIEDLDNTIVSIDSDPSEDSITLNFDTFDIILFSDGTYTVCEFDNLEEEI